MSNEGRVREDKTSGTYFVDIWWKGERHRLYRLPIQGGDMVSCKTREMAETLRFVINRQIEGTGMIQTQCANCVQGREIAGNKSIDQAA